MCVTNSVIKLNLLSSLDTGYIRDNHLPLGSLTYDLDLQSKPNTDQ